MMEAQNGFPKTHKFPSNIKIKCKSHRLQSLGKFKVNGTLRINKNENWFASISSTNRDTLPIRARHWLVTQQPWVTVTLQDRQTARLCVGTSGEQLNQDQEVNGKYLVLAGAVPGAGNRFRWPFRCRWCSESFVVSPFWFYENFVLKRN